MKTQSTAKSHNHYDNAITTQCARMLADFEAKKQLNTFYFRKIGIMHPAGRVKNLRDAGHKIITHFVKERDSNGVPHRLGLYIYCGREGKNNV